MSKQLLGILFQCFAQRPSYLFHFPLLTNLSMSTWLLRLGLHTSLSMSTWLLRLDLHTSFWEICWPKFLGLFIAPLVHQQVSLLISCGENWLHFHRVHCTNDLFGELSICYTYHHCQIIIRDDRHQQFWSIPPPQTHFWLA